MEYTKSCDYMESNLVIVIHIVSVLRVVYAVVKIAIVIKGSLYSKQCICIEQ